MLLQNVSTTETRFLCVNKPNVVFLDRYGRFTHFYHFQCSHSFGALFSLHEQVVHGDAFLDHTAVLAVGDSIGRDHGQMNGLLAG